MAGIKPRVDTVVIFQGDDLARLAKLDDAVADAAKALAAAEKNKNVRLMTDSDPVAEALAVQQAAKAERDAFAAEAEPRGVKVHLIARPRLRWRELMRKHKAGDDVPQDDQLFGMDLTTLPDELLPESIDMEMSTIEGDVVEFLESLSDHDYYDRLFMSAWALNRGSAAADPTQRLLSASSQTSAATSS